MNIQNNLPRYQCYFENNNDNIIVSFYPVFNTFIYLFIDSAAKVTICTNIFAILMFFGSLFQF